MADKDNKSKLTYHVWDKDNNEYDIPDDVVQQRGMDNFAKDFEGGYITMFDNKKQKVDVPIEDVEEYRKQGYIWFDTSGNATPINEIGKKPSPSSPSQGTEQTQYPQEVIDAYNSPDNKPGNFKDMARLNDEYQRGELKKPSLISQALGMMPKVDAGNIGREQKMGGLITNMLLGGNEQQAQPIQQPQANNQQEPQSEQENVSQAQQQEPAPSVPSVVNDNTLMDAKFANYLEDWKKRPNKEGTYFENFVADLEAEGMNPDEATQATRNALNRYANRSALEVTNKVVSALADDTVQDAEKNIEAQWYSHDVQDKLKQEATAMGVSYDDYVAHYLKPAMVQSLVQKYGQNYRDIAEGIATRLYSHDEHVQERLMNQDINEALSDVIGKYTSTSVAKAIQDAEAASNEQMAKYNEQSKYVDSASPFAIGAISEANKTRDPQKILGDLQKKFGKLYQNPQFLNDMSNAAFKVMQRYGMNGTLNGDPKQFKPMINAAIKNELDQLEVKGMIPRGSADYILKTGIENTIIGKVSRKIMQTDYQNWLEDIANQQYQPGFWERVGSGALTFAGDAWSYWLPGAAGGKVTKSMLAKAEGRLASDLMAKGMEAKMAERAAKVLIGKSKGMALKTGAAHGAVTFGGQSAISKPIDEIYRTGQFDENGKVYNPSVGKILANTLGEVAKQSAVGAIMQGGTIANMVGKGRGLATNILADIGGKVVDSSIMTGQQMLERMAQDPSFMPTGKDAAESFLESMANLTSIGLPGMVGKYARFKDAKEFNRKYDFNDQDIAELKRFGYDDLRDAFEKLGINGYRADGEDVQMMGQLTDKYMNLMNDKSVPETLKAKMMAVVEGKRPSSFSPVIDSIIVQPMDNDGKVYLETLNKDGGIIDRKEYSSLEEAQKAEKKLDFEKSLNITSEYEKAYHTDALQDRLNTVYEQARDKYAAGEQLNDEDKVAIYLHQNASAIGDIMQKQQRGMELTEQEQQMVNSYRHFYDSAFENSPIMKEYVRTFEDSQGVEHGTLRKALEGDGKSRTAEQQKLVEEYQKQLYNDIVLKREMNDAKEQMNQNLIEGQRELPGATQEGGASAQNAEATAEKPVDASVSSDVPPTEPPTPPVEGETPTNAEGTPLMGNDASPSDANTASNESKSDAYVMGQNAYQNSDAEGLKAIDRNDDVSKARLKRAFADDEAKMDVVVKAYEEDKDLEQFVAQRANSMTPAQQDAVRKYVEAQDAKKGVYDALQHADDGYGDALKEQLWPYQTEDGNIVPATLTTGQQVFLKKANEYGGGFVVVPGEDGNPTIKQVSSAEIKEVGTPIPLDDYINQRVTEQKNARIQQFFAQYDGSGLKPSDTVEVAMEAGEEPMQMTFAGYSEDGKIVLSDGKDNIALTRDEFNAWRKNALDASIGAELDAEDAQRANDDAAKAEADKKQRYNEGIVGLGMGQPDYSSKDTEPKVAAEYLQEQFGNDHGKLLNLISGSRSDIKEQLDNKRKAASEYEDWLSLNADLDPEKAQKVENDLALVNEQIADLETRYKNWNAIRKEVMTPEEARTLKNERKAEIEKAGVDENAIASNDEREVAVLDNKELKKQYPTMDEASNYIASERKRIYHIQNDEVQPQIDGINKALEQYMNGDIDYSANQLMELNTTKAQLEARQANLSASAKDLKAQDKLLNTLYSAENKEERAKAMEEMTPSEQRKALVADAFKKNDLGAIKEIYKDASIDVMDLTPQTLEEAVSEALRPHSLNAESLQAELGKDNFKYGIGKGYDSNKYNYLLAKKGTGLSVNEFAVRVYNDLPINLQELGYSDQDVRNTLLDMFKTYDNVKEMRNVAFLNRIAAAENELASEEEYYEAQKEREIIERQAEIEEYNSYIQDKALSLPTESELNAIEGMEYDRMMEIEDREREYKEYVKSILPELADYDDRSNEEGYGGGGGLGSDSSRRGVVEGNRQGEEIGGREASSESKTGEGTDSGRTGRQEAGSLERGKGSAIRGTHLPQEASFGERLKSAIAETEPNPSEAQKKAGNYKKGHLQFGGYDFTVETPKGVTRSGKDEHGKPWSVTMHDTYGYILGKIGVDGDHIDMFINDGADLDNFDGNVYVVDQVNPETGEFDEHKVMYGYPSEEAATEAYLANYSKGWKGLGKVTAVPKATFDKWLESSDRKTKPFADYAMVQKEQRAAYKEEMMQDGAHSEAFEKIVELAKEQKEYWDLMEQGEVEPDDVPEVDVAFDMDELLKTLSDEEFKEVSDVLKGIDEEFEYYTADEYERREGAVERKKKAENAKTYEESIKEALKPVTPVAIALKSAVESGDKKAIKQAQKELTEALIASDLGLDYLSGQLAQAKLVKKKDELYKLKRATVKPLTDAIHAIETAENIENSDFIAQMEYDYENDIHPSEEDMPKMQKFVERLLDFHSDKEEKTDSGYTILSSNIQGDKLYPNEKKWFGTGKYRKGVSWVDKQNNCAYEVNPRFNNRGYLSAVGVHKIVPLIKFDRDVKEVKPSEMTEAQKVAFDAVSTMLKKAGIPVKVISNEEMEKVAEEQDNLAISMLMSDPRLRFNIKTPEQKKAAKAAYDWATEHRPDKYAQYAIVNMDKPNMMPEYFEKKSLAEQWRKYYTNAWRIGNYKAFDLNKPFEEQIKNVVGNVPDEFDPYKVDRNREKISDLKKQIKETRALLDAAGNERIAYQNQLMQQYMDEHGLSSENEVPDDVWMKSRQTAMLEYSSKRRELEAKLQDLENQQKTVVEPRISFMRTYHGSGADFSEFDFDHMSEGAGSQFFGWGGYVSSSKKIGKDYAMLAKGDDKGLNFDIKGNVPFYVEDTLRHYIYKNQDIDKGLDNAREDLKKTLETFPDNEIDEDVKELSKVLAKNNDDIVDIKNPSYLYEVNIPDDNGSNYLDWYGKVTQKLKDKAFNALFDEKKNNYISVLKENGFTNKQVERAVSSLDEGEYKKAFDKAETGEGFYNAVSNMIVKSKSESHDDKAASKFLSSLGFTGIKYPAGTILGGAEDGDTNYVIFNPEDMQIVDHNKFAKGKGTVYGYTDGNEIVLNLEHLNPNTPIHEYQHIWRTAAKAKNPELIAHGDKLIKETEWFKDLQNDPNYKHLSEDKLCDEAFARLTGDEGEAILEQMAKDAIKENPLDTAKELSIINRLKKWLKQFWYWTLETFTKWKPEDIEKMTLQDIRNLVLRDLAQGVDPRTVLNEKKTKKADDDKTLAGVHNITEEKLRKALKLDGLANPSLAVIDTAKNGHNNFGEISFIAPSALVDKRTGNTAGTWTTDAYTQRYPSVERQMTEKGYEKFKKWVDGLEYSSADKSEILRQAKDVLENNGVPAWELMYLKEKGIDIKAYDSQVDYRWKEIFENHPTAEDILESMKNDPELNDKVTSLARSEIIFPVRNEISKQVRKQIYAETGVKVSPISPKVRAKVNEIFKRDYAPKLLNNDGSVRKADVKKVVEDMVKQHDDTKKYSFYLSKVKASSYVNQNGLYPDYIRWQENKLDEFGTKNRIFRGYKRDGSRKYVPETLENVSKAMVEDAEGQTNGGEYTSFGSFIAKLANRVDSTDEMRANKDKLSTNEDKEKFYEKWEGEYYDLAKFLYNDVMYGERRLHDIVLQSDPKKYAKKEYGITLTPSFMKKLDALKDAVQKELKSGYFETKFDRPVHLDEFVAAVVPSDLATDVRKGLEKSGLSLYEYDPKKEGDRQRAFDVAVNSKEGIRFMFAGEKGAAEADKAEKVKSLKQKQHEIVTTANPMLDDYHTGIRKVEDIKTFAEAMEEARKDAEKYGFNEWSSYPDETNDILQDALDSGEITIYSSKPIVNGNFVTPSFMQANDYAGGGKVYSKTVPVENVAWINVDEGQYAKVTKKALREVMETEEQGQRMDNLKVAKKMERGKKNAKAIKMATGWERGADDKWRYEVPDIKRYDSLGNLAFKRNHPDYARYAELNAKNAGRLFGIPGNEFSDSETQEFDALKKKWGGLRVEKHDNVQTLDAYIDAPEVFKAYPSLGSIGLKFINEPNDTYSGKYLYRNNEIVVNKAHVRTPNEIKKTLVHEMQHAIQSIEGFAKGGNMQSVRTLINDRISEIASAAGIAENALDEYRDIATHLIQLECARQWKRNPKSFLKSSAKYTAPGYYMGTPKKEQIEIGQRLADEWINDAQYFINSRKEQLVSGETDAKDILTRWKKDWAKTYSEWKDFKEEFDQLDKAIHQKTDFELYHVLAGEVESRNVAARIDMTPEERRASLASETEDVNRDEQILMNVGDASYSIVKDPETVKKLDKEDTVKVYRAMQVIDGKLYPPMAAKVGKKLVSPIELGKWEQADERPDLADDKGFFKLDKANGKSVPARYNPYLHTSYTPLNDQFSEAQNRPNLVTVEVEVPKSELTSGYWADKAKDPVGEIEWPAGLIQKQLTGKRKVVLSRWDKPVRIVPDSEVADVIVNDMFKGKNITMPSNVVTPSLRKELEKRGVPFVETDNRGRIVGGENDGVHYSKVYGKNVKSPILEQKLQKHPDSLMKAGTYFSGGGLVEEGLKGIIDPVVAVEYDRKISGVYRNNFGQHIVTADVRDVDPKELVKHIDGEVEYFHASPVCKNYSQAKSNVGEVELDKETAKSTADFINAVKPRVVTIENVKGYRDSEAIKIITNALDKNGYKWDADVYNAADYGGYTNRERLIVRAVKNGNLPAKPKKQPRKGGWLEAVEDIIPTLAEKPNGVAPWMDARLKADGIDWQKIEKPLYVMGSAYANGKIPHAYGNEKLPTLRTKSGDVIIMPGGKVLRADGRVLARVSGMSDDYKLPATESLAHTIIGNGIPTQLTKAVIAPLLNKDDLSGRNILARLGKSIFKNHWNEGEMRKVADGVANTANQLGGAPATAYTSLDEVPDAYLSDVKKGATGWYDPETHTVHVYLPNCADADEAQRTVFHEKIGHEGMEVLLGGEQGVRKFANFAYQSADKETRGKILDFANKYDPHWQNPDRINIGTQEYIAHLAEEGPTTAEDFSLWTKIKHYLIKVLKKLGIRVPGLLNDKDLRYYLMKAGKALHIWDNMPKEKQEAMMAQASNAEIKDALTDGAGKGKPRQKKGESAIQYMKRVMEWKRWKEAREDTEDPEPPMFYDFDKDAEGKKEWERLNKEWRDSHGLRGEEMPIRPERKEGESDDAFLNRYKEWEKWNDAMGDKENPMPDMFSFEKQKQDEARQKYEDWLTRHELNEQNDADLDLYEGKIYPAETNPEADALEQEVMQDLAEVTSTDVSKEGAATTVKHAVIHRRKNMEEASADDAIYINDVKNRIEKMAESGVFDKLLSDYQGKPNKAEKLAEAIPYIIEAPRRIREIAYKLNSTGVFGEGHIHITPDDVEAIQELRSQLAEVTAKTHTELKDGKEVKLFDDMQGATGVASKMAGVINGNHEKEPGFVPIDGTDILNKNVLPIILKRITPNGVDYKNLSEPMKSVLDSIRDWYNYTFDWLKDNNTLKADTGFTADYVNHLWDKEKSDKNAYAMYVENRQRTKSPNEKPRQINTIMEGLEVGLVPKTTDITKMMAYYSRSNIEAWANKTMLQEVSGLNVIERNEDGEIISSDPLLSSVAPFNLEQYKYFEIPGVGPVWVYNVSPKQVTVKNPITGKDKVLYSEASAGDRFGVVFDTYQSTPFWKAYDTTASSMKKLELGFSGFHAGALTEVYMVQNMVEYGPKKALANFMKYIFADTMKNHQLPCFANPENFKEAATHLVKFGATNDYAAADVQNMFDNFRDAMMKVQEKLGSGNVVSKAGATVTLPLEVATQMLSLINKGMDRALWDFLHDGLKLATYNMRAERTKARAKAKGWTDEQLSKALDEDGQFVNDMFGGQHWDVLGASHRTLRYAGRVLLSPDWNASTTRHFLALTGYGSVWNEATFENFKQYYKHVWNAARGKEQLSAEDWGRLGRQISSLLCYGVGFMVFYEMFANGINAAFRALDEEKEHKKAEELRKTNPNYRSPYELAYPDGMKWYDYLMRGNSLGQQSKIFMGRYADGTEMYIRHGKQFREVPEYLFNHKGELEFPGPMVQRMIGKANPMVRMTLDDINYLSDFQASHADQEIQRKYGKTIGLLYKDALYWAPFLIPSQENKEFKAVDFFFPSSKGFSPWKAQSYFKDFILSGDMEGVVMTYQSCERNGIDPEAQIKAAIGSVKALESAEMKDGITSLQVASERFDEAKSITEKKKMRQKMKKFLSQSEYKAFTQKEALDMVQSYLNGEDDLKEMEKAENKYLMKAKSEDVTEDWRIQAVWNGTMETYDEYQRLKDVDKAKANAFKNSKTNKRLFAARKAISAAKKKMNKAKKQMDGQNDATKMVEIRKIRKELLETLNGME